MSNQHEMMRRFIKRQLAKKGKPTDAETVNTVFGEIVKNNPGPWFNEVTDPELIQTLNNKLIDQITENRK